MPKISLVYHEFLSGMGFSSIIQPIYHDPLLINFSNNLMTLISCLVCSCVLILLMTDKDYYFIYVKNVECYNWEA